MLVHHQRMRLAPLRVVAAGAVCLAAGCGSSPPPQLSASAAERMNDALTATRAAADAHDSEQALGALSALSAIVGRESRAGRLSAADERALRAGIAQARTRVPLDVTAPAPPPTAQQPPEQKPDEPDEDAEGDKEDNKDKGEKPEKDGKGAGKGGG